MINFGVLGPLAVVRDGVPQTLGGAMQRRLLAALLCRAGQPVSPSDLGEVLWNERPPAHAHKALQVYVHRLRRSLGGGDRLVYSGAGYLLRVGPDEVDAARFAALAGQARRAVERGDLVRGSDLYEQALYQWRGPAYTDVLSNAVVADEAARLDEQRLLCQEEWVTVRLRLGHHGELVPELRMLARVHPYREGLRAQLMLALHRAGRRAEALEVYRDTRALLTEQLGVEPGIRLRQLQAAILRADTRLEPQPGIPIAASLAGPPSAAAEEALSPVRVSALPVSDPRPPGYQGGVGVPPSPATTLDPVDTARAVPELLPPDAYRFAGRTAQLAQLDDLLAEGDVSATAILTLTGTAGVGKTALAVHWAHRIAGQFPDGQLFVNLRGFDRAGPMHPAEVIHRFLEAFEVPAFRIPASFTARAGLFRTLVSGRRLLLVLDNARDAEQVRPLLPGSAGCVVVVTSRNQLSGLVVAQGAQPVTLQPMSTAEARALLARRLGQARLAAAPQAVEAIITACAHLPLALAIIAARAAIDPTLPLQRLAEEVIGAERRLDAFDGDDGATDVRTVFSWSFRRLSPAAARLFRILGRQSGDITVSHAAHLADVPPSQVRRLLAELSAAHLVTGHSAGRYRLDDLHRAYASELGAEGAG